jgi:hypothetical protein
MGLSRLDHFHFTNLHAESNVHEMDRYDSLRASVRFHIVGLLKA